MPGRRPLVACVLVASCTSLTLDDSAPFASLHGSPPSLAGRQQLHRGSNEDTLFVVGVDGVQWATQNPLPGDTTRFWPWLVRLGDPPDELNLTGYGLAWISTGAFFDFSHDAAADGTVIASHLTMTRPGAPPRTFDFEGYVDHDVDFADSEAEAALYVPSADGATAYIVRTDGSFRRSFPAVGRAAAMFDLDGELLFTFDGDGQIRAHSTREERDAAIGAWALAVPSHGVLCPFSSCPQAILPPRATRLTVCDDLGLRTLDFTPAEPLVLDGDPCVAQSAIVRRDRFVYRAKVGPNAVLRSVPLDGSAPPVALAHAEAALAVDAERVAWTTRPAADLAEASYQAGDGWVDDRQFMERGRFAIFSADGRHLYFLEHAATSSGVGELRSYEISTGTTHVLALNTRSFAELPDGRVIAVTNSWTQNQWNRVVVIDEARRTVDWIAEGADAFTLIPGSRDVLVDLVTNAHEATMLRMPIPKP